MWSHMNTSFVASSDERDTQDTSVGEPPYERDTQYMLMRSLKPETQNAREGPVVAYGGYGLP
jgi:hypothetical protein